MNSNMICGVAGFTSDANILINYVQTAAQQYLYTYNEDMPCEQLVQKLCDLKQGYTQYGGNFCVYISFNCCLEVVHKPCSPRSNH